MQVKTWQGLIAAQLPYQFREQVMRDIPGAKWNVIPKGDGDYAKFWTFPLSPVVCSYLKCHFDPGLDMEPELRAMAEEYEAARAKKYEGQAPPMPGIRGIEPWNHQNQAFWWGRTMPGLMLGFDMGTGKSATAVALISENPHRRVLIACPKSVISVWPGELERSEKRLVCLTLDKGSVKDRGKELKKQLELAALRNDSLVVVVNYDSFWREGLREILLETEWDIFVMDESHRIKSHNGKASKFATLIASKARKRIALTGTPMPHALESTTPVLTPKGWVQIKDIVVGDMVIGKDGRPTRVIGVWPQGVKPIYRMTFSDSTEIECTGDHLWEVTTRGRRSRGLPELIKKTEDLIKPLPLPNSNGVAREGGQDGLFDMHGAARWHIPIVGPVEFESQHVPIDPYVLGVLLGDGHIGHPVDITTADLFVRDEVNSRLPHGLFLKPGGRYRYRISSGIKGGSLPGNVRGPAKNPVAEAFKEMRLFGLSGPSKFIPDIYLFNDIECRISVLRGLCDADGTSRGSTAVFTSTSKKLFEGVKFLVKSLGGHGKESVQVPSESRLPQGGTVLAKTKYIYLFRLDLNPFLLPGKAEKHKIAWRRPRKSILSIVPAGEKDATCITVEASDGLYVAKDFIVTHNSPLDIFAQYRALDPGVFGNNFHRFKLKYAVMGGFGGKQVLGFQNQAELTARFKSIAFQADKSLLDLPPFIHNYRTCELNPRTRRVYDDLDKKLFAEIEAGQITAANAMVKVLRLQQLTGGYLKLDDGTLEQYGTEKKELLADLLEDIPAEEPVVVFARFTADIANIKEAMKDAKRTCGELSGHANDLKDWQDGKFNSLAVQIRSGGVGISLVRSSYCIYYSVGHSLGDYLQSLDRTHRHGQKKTVRYYHLLADGTIDQKVYRALMARKDVVEAIMKKEAL